MFACVTGLTDLMIAYNETIDHHSAQSGGACCETGTGIPSELFYSY